MRKRTVMSMLMAMLFLGVNAGVFAAGSSETPAQKKNYSQTENNLKAIHAPAKKETQISAAGWCLLGLDVIGAGLSVYALVDENAAAADYDKLFADLNNTTQANYDMLAAKKKDIDSKITFASVSMGLTGAFVIYTVVDLLWLHLAFPDAPKFTYNNDTKTYKVSIDRRF